MSTRTTDAVSADKPGACAGVRCRILSPRIYRWCSRRGAHKWAVRSWKSALQGKHFPTHQGHPMEEARHPPPQKKKSPSGRYPPNEREGKSLKSDQVTGAMLTAKKSFKRNSLAAST